MTHNPERERDGPCPCSAESGITGRTKDVMLSRLIEVAEGNRPRRVGNAASDMRLIAHELEASLALAV